MSFLITARNRRAREWDIVLYESNGTTELVLAADDVVRIKIGVPGESPVLDLSSIDDAEITFTAGTGDCVLKLTAAQAAELGVGAHEVEVLVFDESEDKPKHAESGVMYVFETMLGEVGGEDSSSSQGSSESSSSGESSASSESS